MNSVKGTVIARRLKQARLAKGVTQEQLGVLAGIDEFSASARMNRYESGIHEPKFSIMQKIADALNLPAAFFYCDDDLAAELLKTIKQLAPAEALSVLEFAKSKLSN